LASKGRWFAGGRFSHDGRWITFLDATGHREVIAPFQGKTLAEESNWRTVPAELAHWSPDDTLVYGRATLDGFACLWANRVDRISKQPVGAPLPVFHAHGARAVYDASTSVGSGRIVFTLAERTGNVWMAQWRDR
jgi:hypothetical protein